MVFEFTLIGISVSVGTIVSFIFWIISKRLQFKALLKDLGKEFNAYNKKLYKKLKKSARDVIGVLKIELKEILKIVLKFPDPLEALNIFVKEAKTLLKDTKTNLNNKLLEEKKEDV